MKRILFLSASLAIAFWGCQPEVDVQSTRNDLMELFGKLTDSQTGLIDEEKARAFVDQARSFSDKFPTDTLAALPLYRSAEVSRSVGDFDLTLDTYQKVIKRYPSFHKAAEAKFMLAFTYDEDMNDNENARAAYTSFINDHPEHTFADDAQMLLGNLGKTDEEILRELEAQIKAHEERAQ